MPTRQVRLGATVLRLMEYSALIIACLVVMALTDSITYRLGGRRGTP